MVKRAGIEKKGKTQVSYGKTKYTGRCKKQTKLILLTPEEILAKVDRLIAIKNNHDSSLEDSQKTLTDMEETKEQIF